MSQPNAQRYAKPSHLGALALPGGAVSSLPRLATPLENLHSVLVGSAARLISSLVLVAVGYYLMARFGLELRLGGSTKSALWPANALLISTFLLTPMRRWWMYWLAVIPPHILVHWAYHLGAAWIAYQIGHNTLLVLGAALILRYLAPSLPGFDHLQDVLTFLATAILMPGFSALTLLFVVTRISSPDTLQRHGWLGNMSDTWSQIWLTNSVSCLVFVPVFVLCGYRGASWFRHLPWRRVVEAVVLANALILVSHWIFSARYLAPGVEPAVFLIPLPLLLWAAIRFGPAGNCLAVAAVVCVSLWETHHGGGPFLHPSAIAKVESVQLFWLLLSIPLMPLAALIHEHKHATQALGESEYRFRQLFEQASIGVALESLEGQLTLVNPAFCSMLGYEEHELLKMSCVDLSHPDDKSTEAPLFVELCNGARSSYHIDKRFFRKDGSIMWGRVSVSMFKPQDDGGAPLVIGMLKDISAIKQRDEELVSLSGRLIQAQEEERCHISRELHDDIGQQAAAIATDSLLLKQQLKQRVLGRTERLAETLVQQTSDLATSIHKLSHELRSSRLQFLGLSPALKELCEKLAAQHGVFVEFKCDEETARLPQDVELCLFRVAQEALTNVGRHSGANTALVDLRSINGRMRLRVSDDGVGFDTTASSVGIGLKSMRERLRLVGGELSLKSSAQWGTEVTAYVAASNNSARSPS